MLLWQKVVEIWRPQQERSILAKGLRYVLLGVPTLLFFIGISLRKLLYRLGFLTQYKAPARVISIGNLELGGTGKTPLAIKIAERALSSGKRLAVLSRGYGGTVSTPHEVREGDSASVVGDEPLLMKKRLPTLDVWVSSNRVAAAKEAIIRGAERLLLDDGMQHLPLYRDHEIVILRATAPLDTLQLFPLGTLREPVRELERASLVVLNDCQSKKLFDLRLKEIRCYTQSPVVGMRPEIANFYHVTDKKEVSVDGAHVALFSAIGQNQRFKEMVEQNGALVSKVLFHVDHAPFTAPELDALAALPVQYLICTEKDLVKLPLLNKESQLKLLSCRLELKIVQGEEAWEMFLKRIFE